MPEIEATLQAVLARVGAGGGCLSGTAELRFRLLQKSEREAATVFRLAVTGAPGLDAVFVKVFKPREEGPGGRDLMRKRVERDFEITTRLHRSLGGGSRYAAPRPLACFPELLVIVTAEARGRTLSELLERNAAWWPSPRAVRHLAGVLADVGGWLRAFQALEAGGGTFSLDGMREYIDVRLERLLATDPPALDLAGRERVLRYFERTAALVDAGDLREVPVHGDLAPSNVLVGDGEVTVIDFAMAASGGLFMDVARLYTQLEFLTAKPKFRPAVIRELQRALLKGFDPALGPERPLFELFVLQHLLCHMSNITRNPARPIARLYNRHQLRLRQRWLQTFAA